MYPNKIIVKVGNKSTSRFKNVKVYRAITVSEMRRLCASHENAILVIEHIKSSEYSNMVAFLTEFTSKESNHVFFYVPDNDDNTTGVADELNLDIYLNIKDLYRAIQLNCDINVDIDLYNNSKGTDTSDNPFNTDFVDDFNSEIDDSFNDVLQATSEATTITTVDVKTIRNLTDTGFIVDDTELGIEPEPGVIEEPKSIEPEVSVKSDEVQENQEVQEEQVEQVVTEPQDSEELIRLRDETERIKAEFDQYRIESEKVKLESIKTKSDLDNANTEIGSLQEQVADAISRIRELNKAVKAVKDERDMFKSELEAFETSKIIEDPVTLSDYEAIKLKIAEYEERLANASTKTNEEIEELLNQNRSLQSQLLDVKSSKLELEDRLGELEIIKVTLEKDLAEASDTSFKDNQITDLSNQVIELTEASEKLQSQIVYLESEVSKRESEIDNKEAEISRLLGVLNTEISNREHLIYLIRLAMGKMQNIVAMQATINDLTSTNNTLENEIVVLRADLEDKETKLNKVTNDTELRVELARKFAREELENTKRENITLQSRLDIISAQLTAKETQYDTLIRMTGLDETGACTVIENNKTLELMNTNLRAQLAEMKTAYEAAERGRVESMQAISTLRDQNGKLTSQVRAMSANFSGGAGTGVIPPIQYNGRAQVISVFGSGSYGVTTTAVSAANLLASNYRTLFIDFDLLSAKADGLVNVNPKVVGVPGVNPATLKASGLGVLFEHGAQFFATYIQQIILKAPKTKDGCLHYISGLYTNVDVVKIIACDYNRFLNCCASYYDFIVIDFGRLGASDVNNQITKIFSDISRKSIMVSSSDIMDIRSGRLAIQKAKLNTGNISWLMNLSRSTKIDPNAKSFLTEGHAVMPFINDFYGSRKHFLKDGMSRDKFRAFLDKVVLGH